MKKFIKGICWPMIFLGLLMTGCQDDGRIQPLKQAGIIEENYVKAKIYFCGSDPHLVQSNLKFIFVLDKSASNRSAPGTDPFGQRRYDSILTFLDERDGIDSDQVSYFLINFNSTVSNVTEQFVDAPTFETIVNQEKTKTDPLPPAVSTDQGATDYIAALERVKTVIVDDLQKTQQSSARVNNYIIFFISDGAPIDSVGVPQLPLQIKTKVQQISAIQKDVNYKLFIENIQFNTGYYYQAAQDLDAVDLLRNMVSRDWWGDQTGEFVQFGSGEAINFSQYAWPDKKIKRVLKEIFAKNMNIVFDDENISLDQDGDGISDNKEQILGSDPRKADSDDNGVSDGVEYYISGKPCDDSLCRPELANPFSSCLSYLVDPLNQNHKIYLDTDGDKLNDCEETAMLNSDRMAFDTNNDSIPDDLAFMTHGLISYKSAIGNSGRQLDPDMDQVNNYQELKSHTPLGYPNQKIQNLKSMVYGLKLVEMKENQRCYQLDLDNIYRIGEGNILRIYILEQNSMISHKSYLRIYEYPLRGELTVIDLRMTLP